MAEKKGNKPKREGIKPGAREAETEQPSPLPRWVQSRTPLVEARVQRRTDPRRRASLEDKHRVLGNKPLGGNKPASLLGPRHPARGDGRAPRTEGVAPEKGERERRRDRDHPPRTGVRSEAVSP